MSDYHVVDIYRGSPITPEFMCRKLIKSVPSMEEGIVIIDNKEYIVNSKPHYYTFDFGYDSNNPDVDLYVREF